MKKFSRVFTFALVIAMCFTMTGVSYAKSEEKEKNIKPDSYSYNRIDDKTNKNIDEELVDDDVSANIFLGYDYIDGTAYLGSKTINRTYGYIWGTSVSYVAGASPNYTLTVTKSVTKASKWSASASVDFSVKVVEAEVQGSYESSDSATISKGQTWSCGFDNPGSYELTWYMRGHTYPVYGKAKIVSTGADHGNITSVYLGKVTFPTDEIHFDVSEY